MFFTDTAGTAFDKLSIDIVGLLPRKRTLVYTHDKDLLIKYSMAVPFKQLISSEIAEAFVEKFINTYIATKCQMDYKSQIS